MRAFASLWAASLALAGCAAPPAPAPVQAPVQEGVQAKAPARVVSLNLCTDELLLLLGAHGQIVSVTHLAQQPAETPLWREARRHPANDGALASVAGLRPDLVLTMGGGGDRLHIAERLGVRLVDLPYPQSLADVEAAVRTVADALGRPAQGAALIGRLARLRQSTPQRQADALWIGTGGRTVAANGLAAQWMTLAGLRQRPVDGDQITLEALLTGPPHVLLRSDYRQAEYSSGQAWLAHPLARGVRGSHVVSTDGRRWTCAGPLLIDEILRLRGAAS